MNYLAKLKFGQPETLGKRPDRGESSIIQYFPRAQTYTWTRLGDGP